MRAISRGRLTSKETSLVCGKLFVDAYGCSRAVYQSPHEVLGWYLEQDIQGGGAFCEELYVICDSILSGSRLEWSCVGNAHDITITSAGVRIENLFSDGITTCDLTIEDFKIALRSWKELVDSNRGRRVGIS